MRALLDVNVLIALLDSDHIHHQLATRWMASAQFGGWASCPITQNGCIRIMSQPAYPGALPLRSVVDRLGMATRHSSHQFWADSLALVGHPGISWDHLSGHRQLTDAYLLALAVSQGGRFVTIDSRVALRSVPEAKPEQLVVLAALPQVGRTA
jgi:toxin-antitoxin system PIN domain toxin